MANALRRVTHLPLVYQTFTTSCVFLVQTKYNGTWYVKFKKFTRCKALILTINILSSLFVKCCAKYALLNRATLNLSPVTALTSFICRWLIALLQKAKSVQQRPSLFLWELQR